jgi:NAD(P)-dependent dehydrogenase (short-subunit alcohol dehydrogenase family)
MATSTCIVVGYGPGNGQGIARAFGAAGFRLGLIARSPARQAAALAELRQAGHAAELFAGDAGDEGALTAAIRQAVERLGPPAVLVYNAAAFRMAPPTRVTAADLVADFRTNVAGALAAANAVLPGMKARGSGAVLFTGGGWALYPDAAVCSTAIGKAGLRHLALMLQQELQSTGVRAGTVTVMGQVKAGTAFDPDTIGAAFVELYRRPADGYQPELQFTGA